MKPKSTDSNFAALLQGFFCQHLIQQRNASTQTVASYRDTFRLLLGYLHKVRKKQPSAIVLADLDAPVISAFLDHLEKKRHNCIRTRNTRFAALRSFLKYASALDPASLPLIQRVLAMPMKRFSRRLLGYLSRDEVTALLDAPNPATQSGQRDRVLFAVLYNTGARISEALALRRNDVSLGSARHVQITGKGRKQRMIPLWKDTAKRLREWMAKIAQDPQACLFPNRDGRRYLDLAWRNACAKRSGLPPAGVQRFGKNGFRHIRFATRPPCTYCNQKATSPPLPCGSVMRE